MAVEPEKPVRTRASDAEREAVVERLSAATAEGRLTLEELADRSEAAYLARYRDDLDRIAADLPQEPLASREFPEPSAPTGHAPQQGGSYYATMDEVTVENPVAGPSGEIHATAVLADLTLNLALTKAPPSGELRVVAKAWLGDVRIIVPEGVAVAVDCGEILGGVRDCTRDRFRGGGRGTGSRAQGAAPLGAPCVRVTGKAVVGDVVVRRPRGGRRSAWREWIEEALDTALDIV